MKYTIKGKHDGFGAQYHAMLSCIVYCHYYNHEYIHTPFKNIEHNTDVEKANHFIGIPYQKASFDIEKFYVEEVHWSPTPSIYYTDEIVNTIRDYYFKDKLPIDIDIAIHIRRGDVSAYSNATRYTSNSDYCEIIKKLQQKYPHYKITIFSEGKYEDFTELGLPECCFQLNTNIFDVFHGLVCAKILVLSKSSFSYSAGILNPNTVYYTNFWHKKLDRWHFINTI
jgi:hypothetical protein